MRIDSLFAQMEVQSILLDDSSKISVILLTSVTNEEQIFPLVAGIHGGETIAAIIKKKQYASPLTHDLLIDIMHALRGKVEKVVMGKDGNEDVVSTVHLIRCAEKIIIEARACDALALALETDAPIYVRKSQLLTFSEITERIQHIHEERFLAWLNALEA